MEMEKEKQKEKEMEMEITSSGSQSQEDSEVRSPSPLSTLSSEVDMEDTSFTAALTAATSAMMISTTSVSVGGGSGSGDFPAKKRRGRPRKYDAIGNIRMTAALYQEGVASPSLKRPRGSRGSKNSKILASLGGLLSVMSGGKLTPHAFTINAGENVAEKILSFCQKGPLGVCVLSATGAIASATLHQPVPLGSLTYEGRFEIVSLTGSYTVTGTNRRVSCRNGRDLNVSLACSDGRVIGGGVDGSLIAASPIQAVLGTFVPRKYKDPYKYDEVLKGHRLVPLPSPPPVVTSSTAVTVSGPIPPDYCLFPATAIPRQPITLNFADPSTIRELRPDINISPPCVE